MKNTENEPPLKHDKQRLEAAIEAISTPLFSTLMVSLLVLITKRLFYFG